MKRGIKFKISNTLFRVSFAVFCSRIDTQLTSKCSRGYSDIFIHTYARAIFGGFNNLSFNTFLGFQKNENFVEIFIGSSPNWTSFRG